MFSYHDSVLMDRRKDLLKILSVAECAAAQLLSLKDSLHDEFTVCHHLTLNVHLNCWWKITRGTSYCVNKIMYKFLCIVITSFSLLCFKGFQIIQWAAVFTTEKLVHGEAGHIKTSDLICPSAAESTPGRWRGLPVLHYCFIHLSIIKGRIYKRIKQYMKDVHLLYIT